MVLLVALATPGARASNAAAAGAEPSLRALENATYPGIYERPVKLKNGIYLGKPFVKGSAARPRVELIQGAVARGTLQGEGSHDAAVLLAESSGGSGSMVYLAAMSARQGKAVSIGTARVGDRVQVRSFSIETGGVVMELVAHAPEDPLCCPTLKVTSRWECGRSDSLVEVSRDEHGRVSIQDLEGPTWQMTHLDREKPIPSGATVTAKFAGGTISGTSGCNRYSASVEGSGESEGIRIGPIAGTRMACPEPMASLESQVLAALAGVQKFSFSVGKLILTYQVENRLGSMIFIARQETKPD